MYRPQKSKSPGSMLIIQKPSGNKKNRNPTRSLSPPRKNRSPQRDQEGSGKGKKKSKNKESDKKKKHYDDVNDLMDMDIAGGAKDKEQAQADAKTAFTKENILKRKAQPSGLETTDFLGFDGKLDENQKESNEDLDPSSSRIKKVKSEPVLETRGQNNYRGRGNERNDRNERNEQDTNYVTFDEETKVAPWMLRTTHKVKNTLVRLHNEIIDFVNYVAPRDEEHRKRELAYKR